MAWWHKLPKTLRALFRKETLDADLDKELRAHLDMQVQENLAVGMSPEEARHAAMLGFGSIESVKETCREQRGFHPIETLVADLRFAIRVLLKNPGFAAVSVITLALGIGANAAIFSILNAVLLKPLPYPDPDRLVTVCESNLKRGYSQVTVRPANLRAWAENSSAFSELGGEIYESFNLMGRQRAEHLNAGSTTPNFFSVFGVQPLLGRTYSDGDRRVAVLSYRLWRRCFGQDPSVIGRSITLSGVTYTVVGVMSESFKIFPIPMFGLPTGDFDPELWVPYEGPMNETRYHFFACLGRLKPGVTVPQAQSEVQALAERMNQQLPHGDGWSAKVQPLRDHIVGGARPAFVVLMAAAAFVLLIACVNVANLSLARSSSRGREFAIRSALGAGRLRIVRQLLAESMLLAATGGALGILLANGALLGLIRFLPAQIPRLDEARLDGPVLGFGLFVSVATGLLFGLAPALDASKRDRKDCLKEASLGHSASGPGNRARSLLVVAEVACAMVLLAGAGLMLNSFARLTNVNPGFKPAQLVSFDAGFSELTYQDDAKRARLVKQLREIVQTLPGVQSAGTVYGLPFGMMLNATCGALIEGRSSLDSPEKATVAWRVVSPGYLETIEAPLAQGRAFSEKLDRAGSLPVAMINETFARKYFAGQNPIGKRIQIFTVNSNWTQIVGVVKDVKLSRLDGSTTAEIYQPDSQQPPWMFSLVVRTSLPLAQMEKMARTAAASIDKDMPLFNARTMDQAIDASVASQRLTMTLLGLFASLAIILTAIGVYGVASYSVSQRTRELGIRMALGAQRSNVLSLVLSRGIALTLIGTAIGLGGGLGLARLIGNQLFQVSPNDPFTFGCVTFTLVIVALLAYYLPARRATKVDPMVSLRYE